MTLILKFAAFIEAVIVLAFIASFVEAGRAMGMTVGDGE